MLPWQRLTLTSQTIEVPDLGSDDEIEIIEIHIKEKDSIEVDDVLITLESDKAAMDVPAPYAGVIETLLVAVGDKVKTGSPIAKILASAPAAKKEAPAAKQEIQPAEATASSKPAPAPSQAVASAPAHIWERILEESLRRPGCAENGQGARRRSWAG